MEISHVAKERISALKQTSFPYYKLMKAFSGVFVVFSLIIFSTMKPRYYRFDTSKINYESSLTLHFALSIIGISFLTGVLFTLFTFFLYIFGNNKISARAEKVLKPSYIFVFGVGTALVGTISINTLLTN